MAKQTKVREKLFIPCEEYETGRRMWVAKTAINFIKEVGSANNPLGEYEFHIMLKEKQQGGQPIIGVITGSLDDINDLVKNFEV